MSKNALLPICEAWKGFVDMRKKIKKPLTDNAAKRRAEKLAELHASGHDPVAVLNQSEDNCWQDLYPIKDTSPVGGKLSKADEVRASNYQAAREFCGGEK